MILTDLLQDQNPWWRDGAIRRARGYPVRRDLQPKVLSRLLRVDDRRAVLLLGPRQVGKTILLLQLADDLLAQGWPPRTSPTSTSRTIGSRETLQPARW